MAWLGSGPAAIMPAAVYMRWPCQTSYDQPIVKCQVHRLAESSVSVCTCEQLHPFAARAVADKGAAC